MRLSSAGIVFVVTALVAVLFKLLGHAAHVKVLSLWFFVVVSACSCIYLSIRVALFARFLFQCVKLCSQYVYNIANISEGLPPFSTLIHITE